VDKKTKTILTVSKAKPIIVVEKVSKEFGKGDATTKVLKEVSLEILPGEYVILFGPSGCGKSTLLNCICGLEKPTSGKVLLRNQDLSRLNQKELSQVHNKKIGMIFQQFNVIKSFSVIQNIALPQLIDGIPRQRRSRRAISLLQMFDLEKIAHRTPTEISGGQQQRVAIARALINNPWIIIADEPTGNLDSKTADDVMDMISKLNKKSKRTIILVTHNGEYLKFADTIYHMKDGEITRKQSKNKVENFEEKQHEEIKIN